MSDNHATTGDEVTPAWLHDRLMAQIEPELMLANAEVVEEMYRRSGETPEQQAARMKQYEAAYLQYEAALQRLTEAQLEQYKAERSQERVEAAEASQAHDRAELAALEDELTNPEADA